MEGYLWNFIDTHDTARFLYSAGNDPLAVLCPLPDDGSLRQRWGLAPEPDQPLVPGQRIFILPRLVS